MVIEKPSVWFEHKKDVVILLDSIPACARLQHRGAGSGKCSLRRWTPNALSAEALLRRGAQHREGGSLTFSSLHRALVR